MGARTEFVPGLVEELFYWSKNSDLNPLIKSSVIHFELEIIYPNAIEFSYAFARKFN